MIGYGAMLINGQSTADLPFLCAVEQPPRPVYSKKKDKLYDLDHVNGYIKQSIDAWEAVTMEAKLYIHGASPEQIRQFKSWLSFEGWFSVYGDWTMEYRYQALEIEFGPKDAVGGHEVALTFSCDPFGYGPEIVERLGNEVDNRGSAPIYPLLKVRGNTGQEVSIKIGDQKLTFVDGLQSTVWIQCRLGEQDVYDQADKKYNDQVRGEFFIIPPGKHSVFVSRGLTVEMTYRLGWL